MLQVTPVAAFAVVLLTSICSAQLVKIDGLTLMDTANDVPIRSLSIPGDTINISPDADGDELTIRVEVSGDTASIRSVIFYLDFIPFYQTDNRAPYALNGNRQEDYKSDPSLAQLGPHTVTATAYSERDGTGAVLDTVTVTLNTAFGPSSPVAPIVPPTEAPTAPLTDEYDVSAYNHEPDGELTGALRKWHKITLGFHGPTTSEDATPNPFTDYRLDVTFSHTDNGDTYRVPGYYAADGNAANTGASSGNVWLVHFTPDAAGEWTWVASFVEGDKVAQNDGTGISSSSIDGKSGSFTVLPTDKTGRDHRAKGRLEYVGKHHLQFAETGDFFLKAGADSPENFLAYDEFDNTPNSKGRRKSWGSHLQHYRIGDPTWSGGKGRGMIGAINYLALDMGVNAFSFLSMNIDGDDKNVFPYVSDNKEGDDLQRIDVSKTAQWEVVFEHADHIGFYLHFKTQETENDQLLDGGALGNERKLYYRELIARFGHHLALNWNIGEENTNTVEERKAFADFFKLHDPYNSPIVIHTYGTQIDSVYQDLVDHPTYNGASIQTNSTGVFPNTLRWVQESDRVDNKWVVANDEQGHSSTGVTPDENDPTHDIIRKEVLWGNIMAGGAGVEYYFGYDYPNSDLTCQDWKSRENMWKLSKHALDFFTSYVPFWEMSNRDDLISSASAWCLSNDDVFVIYLQNGGTTTIDLPDTVNTFEMSWYDPRNGGDLQQTTTISGGQATAVGTAPSNTGSDWTILITPTTSGTSRPITTANVTPSPVTRAPMTLAPTTSASTTPAPVTPVPTTPVPATSVPTNPVPATPAPTSPAPLTSAPTINPVNAAEVIQFILINATSNSPIREIVQGDTIYLADLPPSTALNVKAVTFPEQVGSVVFNMNGEDVRTENIAPYALSGDRPAGDYFDDNGVQLGEGQKELVATPWTERGGVGTRGIPYTIKFTIVEGNAPAPAAVPTVSLTPAPTPDPVGQVTEYILINAASDTEIRRIKNGDMLYLLDLPAELNVRAVTDPEMVGSVKFEMDGVLARTENVAPYALAGDKPAGEYFVDGGLQLSAGINKNLTATPYSQRLALGATGTSLSITFTIDAGTAPCGNDDTFVFTANDGAERYCAWIIHDWQRDRYCTRTETDIPTRCSRSCHQCPEPEGGVSRDITDFTFLQGHTVRTCSWFFWQHQTDNFCLPGSAVATKCNRACGLSDPPCEDNPDYQFTFADGIARDCAWVGSSMIHQVDHCGKTAVAAQCPIVSQHPACPTV